MIRLVCEYEYDYENRIVKITKDGQTKAEFSYDALASRIEKKDLIDPNNTRRYYYNYNWQVLAEYDGAGSYNKLFIYGNYIDEVLYTQGTGPGTPRYYVHDHLYSPAALVYANGTVLERYEYDAYGNPTIWNADFTAERANSNYGNPYLFTGRRVDILDSGSLKIQYNRNRYYDYYSGRWLTHDPLGIVPNAQKPNKYDVIGQYRNGLSLYEYVKSNSYINVDPNGLSLSSLIYGPVHHMTSNCNICGPDITDLLIKLRENIFNEFDNLGPVDKWRVCKGKWHGQGWDINELAGINSCAITHRGCCTNNCAATVNVNGKCYNGHEVNYFLWGTMGYLCRWINDDPFGKKVIAAAALFGSGSAGSAKSGACKVAWTISGFSGIRLIPDFCAKEGCKNMCAGTDVEMDKLTAVVRMALWPGVWSPWTDEFIVTAEK